jgi:hypothetical protein
MLRPEDGYCFDIGERMLPASPYPAENLPLNDHQQEMFALARSAIQKGHHLADWTDEELRAVLDMIAIHQELDCDDCPA